MAYALNSQITDFTTTSVDYDLLQDVNVLAKLQERGFTTDYITKNGLKVDNLLVVVNTPTQIKVNGSTKYDNFLMDLAYPYNGENNVFSLKIKDSGISGQIMINIK